MTVRGWPYSPLPVRLATLRLIPRTDLQEPLQSSTRLANLVQVLRFDAQFQRFVPFEAPKLPTLSDFAGENRDEGEDSMDSEHGTHRINKARSSCRVVRDNERLSIAGREDS